MKKIDIDKIINAASKEHAEIKAKREALYRKLYHELNFEYTPTYEAPHEPSLWESDEDFKKALEAEEQKMLQAYEEREEKISKLFSEHTKYNDSMQTVLSILNAFNQEPNEYKRLTLEQLPEFIVLKSFEGTKFTDIEGTSWYYKMLKNVTDFISKALGQNLPAIVLPAPNVKQIAILTAQAARNLLEAQEKGDTLALEVTSKKAKNPAYIYMDVAKIPGVVGVENLTRYDNSVLNAICTLSRNGATRFTSETIYKILTGVQRVRDADKQLKEIDRSIYRLLGTRVTIDVSEQRRLYKDLVLDSIDDSIIHVRRVKGHIVKPTGAPVKWTVWELLQEPILYTYAQSIGQLATFPLEYLTNTQTTQQGINLRQVLLMYIRMAQGGTGELQLKYSTLYRETGVQFSETNPKTAEVQAQRMRKTIDAELTLLQNKGLIKSFKTYKSTTDKKRLEGVKISVAKQKTQPAKKK